MSFIKPPHKKRISSELCLSAFLGELGPVFYICSTI
jgi:hypothetical protein